ncbi:MAG TPA: ABC transporter substrate-binding protein [Candidatus Scatomonas pullistercoris]|uniref:ABC transporter substrate-binding protein n=1 Tax=Candidatus Scatomonas pullistercoris TaxID=2840920 RepID=A0A9D1P2I9_9FIRM|nr:ABC transporter substrate-binding protein [Candidatus Scatomonas pullistercoris]
MKKKITAALLALGLLVSALAGCGGGNGDSGEAGNSGEKTLVFGDTTFNAENGEADINPHRDSGGWACIRYGVGETLFRFSDSMEVEPWLAESYENVDDLTWTITLRKGVSFTSGRAMDAQAVKECLDALMEEHARAAGNLQIAEISAQGQTVTIRTEEPVPALINYLADPYACIIDMEAGVTPEGIVSGTGPYQAVSLVTDTSLSLVKNENYWDGEPKIDRITVRTISDGDTLTMALQSGEIDAAYGMPYASYPLFENDNYTFTSCATSRVFFGAMNFESAVTSDPAVRRAIAMGIDRDSFVETLLGGNGYPAAGVYPDSFTFGGDAVSAESYDPEGAAKALEEAGWVDTDGDGVREKEGQRLTLRWLTYPSRQELPLLAEAAQASLGEIGFEVQINNTADHNTIRTDTGAWDIYVSAFVTAPTGDPEYFFSYCCLDDSAQNVGHYHSDRLEELAEELSGTFDTDRRGELAVEMQQILLDDNAYVFCSHLRMSMISRASVTGLAAHPCDYYEITAELDLV